MSGKTYIPKRFRFIMILVIMSLLVYNFFIATIIEKKNASKFYKQVIATQVISKNSYAGGRTNEYHLGDGLKVYFFPRVKDRLLIGDSISKGANTYHYRGYRKQLWNNKYALFTTYNFGEIQ